MCRPGGSRWWLRLGLVTAIGMCAGTALRAEDVRRMDTGLATDESAHTSVVTVFPDEPVPPSACWPEVTYRYGAPSQHLTAAFYFPWYVPSPECPADSEWCNCFWAVKPDNPRPVQGFYDSGDPAVIGWHLDQMQANGIDVVAIEWSGADSLEDTNMKERWRDAVAATALTGRAAQTA